MNNFDEYEGSTGRTKFIVGGVLILLAVVYLIASATQATAQYFYTIDEMVNLDPELLERELRVSGAVDGETIDYDPETLTLKFTVIHVPADLAAVEDEGGLAEALHAAVTDPTRSRVEVVYIGVMPDLLRHEAQAIMTGHMGTDGIFYADELLLKCPTRYEEIDESFVE